MDVLSLIWVIHHLPDTPVAPIRQEIVASDLSARFARAADISPPDGLRAGSKSSQTADWLDVQGSPRAATDITPLAPQLRGMAEDTVDWAYWSALSAVTVVESNTVLQNPDINDGERLNLVPQAHTCPAANYALQQAAAVEKTSERLLSPDRSFTLQINNVPIGVVPHRPAAEAVAAQLREVLPELQTDAAALQPWLGESVVGGSIHGQPVVELSAVFHQADLQPTETATALLAAGWINNLRQVFGAPPLPLGDLQMLAAGLAETPRTLNGIASWYGPYFHGRQTATGEIFNQHELTAAHPSLPFGTYLKVRNLNNDRTVVVRVNDRGPYVGQRSLDLSYAAAQCLGSDIVGVIPYEATILAPGLPQHWQADAVTARR